MMNILLSESRETKKTATTEKSVVAAEFAQRKTASAQWFVGEAKQSQAGLLTGVYRIFRRFHAAFPVSQ